MNKKIILASLLIFLMLSIILHGPLSATKNEKDTTFSGSISGFASIRYSGSERHYPLSIKVSAAHHETLFKKSTISDQFSGHYRISGLTEVGSYDVSPGGMLLYECNPSVSLVTLTSANPNIDNVNFVLEPRNRAINTPLSNFLQQHPILFQLLQRFLKL